MKSKSQNHILLFQINSLESEFDEFKIRDSIFRYLTIDEKEQLQNESKLLINSLFLEICLKTKTSKNILDTAYIIASNCMDIIRIFLSSDLRTHDNNLLFNLSGHYCKKTSDSEKFSVSFSRTLQYQKGFSWKISKEHYEKSNLANLFRYPINKKITSNIERSFHWFSLAIIETDYPSKIIKLFTALESILTTIDEKRKAEHIIFRMAFFNYYFEKQFPSPSKIKELYELRSQAVHGSKINGPKFKESTIINEYQA